MTSNVNLHYAIKRLFEIELGFKPDQFCNDDLYKLSKLSLALKNGIPIKEIEAHIPTIGVDGIFDFNIIPCAFMIDIEKAFEIEIKDMEAEKIITYLDLEKNISKKWADSLYLHQKYFDSLLLKENINLLIVGRDPYPDEVNRTGIPFCTIDKKSLLDGRKSGKHLLKGLGTKVENDNQEAEQIFFKLLEEGIGFVNASYFFIGKNKSPKDYQLQISNYLNHSIYQKSKCIVVTKSAHALLKKKLKLQSDDFLGDNIKYFLPSNFNEKIIEVPHPASRKKHTEEYKKVWGVFGNLLKITEVT